jgi:hypothetical protein
VRGVTGFTIPRYAALTADHGPKTVETPAGTDQHGAVIGRSVEQALRPTDALPGCARVAQHPGDDERSGTDEHEQPEPEGV